MPFSPSVTRALGFVAVPAAVAACGSPDEGPSRASEDSLCTQLESTNGVHTTSICNPGTSSSGGGGGGGGTTYSWSCGLILGTGNPSAYQLPYNTQSPPSGLTTAAGWISTSQAQMDQMKANMNSICSTYGGILCFFALVTYATIHEQWAFQNQLADALVAAGGPDPTTSPRLVFATGDMAVPLHTWYGVEISAAQAYSPQVQQVIRNYGAKDATQQGFVVQPQIFQCTRTNDQTGASTTRYYEADDPDCTSVACSTPMMPRVPGAS